ncbi:MAG: hypothetical protein AAF604_22260 [Acidobacteriota bacterium]
MFSEIPTTAEDIAALRAVKKLPTNLEPWEASKLLYDALPEAAKKAPKKTFAGWEPFEL